MPRHAPHSANPRPTCARKEPHDPQHHLAGRDDAAGRRADSARRRQRVIAALNHAGKAGAEISVSGIARAAGVDRTFLYRHRDLLEQIHAARGRATRQPGHAGPAVTRASLQADLLAAHERAARLNARIRQLEKRLSEPLGEQAWRESGLGAPADIDELNARSPSSNNKSPTCASSSPNATTSSPPPAPPTASSWPASTTSTKTGDTPQQHLRHTCRTRYCL